MKIGPGYMLAIVSPHPDGSLVAEHTVDGQPGWQVQQTLENLLIQLQVGELALPLQRAQVDFVRRQVLSKPAEASV